MPTLLFVFGGLVVVAVVGMATGSWLWFGIALAVHAIASAIVIPGAFRAVRSGSEADRHSQALDRRAGEAVGDRPRNIENELEALKGERPR